MGAAEHALGLCIGIVRLSVPFDRLRVRFLYMWASCFGLPAKRLGMLTMYLPKLLAMFAIAMQALICLVLALGRSQRRRREKGPLVLERVFYSRRRTR